MKFICKITATIILVSSVFGLSSCSKQQITHDPTTEDSTISFESFANSATFFFPHTDTIFGRNVYLQINVSLMMPLNSNRHQNLRAKIEETAFGDYNFKSLEETFSDFSRKSAEEAGYGSFELVSDSTSNILPEGFINIEGTVASMSTHFLSYAISQYIYPILAANGTTTLSYVNYDFDSDSIITLDKLIPEDNRHKVLELITERILATYPSAEITDLPSEFYFDYEGRIVFVYQQGEILYRAAGPITVSFYPQELPFVNFPKIS